MLHNFASGGEKNVNKLIKVLFQYSIIRRKLTFNRIILFLKCKVDIPARKFSSIQVSKLASPYNNNNAWRQQK